MTTRIFAGTCCSCEREFSETLLCCCSGEKNEQGEYHNGYCGDCCPAHKACEYCGSKPCSCDGDTQTYYDRQFQDSLREYFDAQDAQS